MYPVNLMSPWLCRLPPPLGLTFVFICWHIIVRWIAWNLAQTFTFPSNKFEAALYPVRLQTMSWLTVCQQLLHYCCFSFLTSSVPPRDSFTVKKVWKCLLSTCQHANLERLHTCETHLPLNLPLNVPKPIIITQWSQSSITAGSKNWLILCNSSS